MERRGCRSTISAGSTFRLWGGGVQVNRPWSRIAHRGILHELPSKRKTPSLLLGVGEKNESHPSHFLYDTQKALIAL